jgi:hypothetical protein
MMDVWVRVGIPTLATLALGVATIYIDQRISARAEREQSSRLYTELISRREEASSGLRADMFATILTGFLESESGRDGVSGSKRLDLDLLKLELLALNFGEALSLGPLFAMMDRRIRTDSSYNTNLERVDRRDLQSRLESLARRVADAQRGALEGQAQEFTVKVPSANTWGEDGYLWPSTEEDELKACLALGRTQRRFIITFDEAVEDAKTMKVGLIINTEAMSDKAPASCVEALSDCSQDLPDQCVEFSKVATTESSFRLNPFNLPLIDNSLLSKDQRFAMVMRRFSYDSDTEIVGILFPGAYAGRRDKLTLDQAIDALRGRLE